MLRTVSAAGCRCVVYDGPFSLDYGQRAAREILDASPTVTAIIAGGNVLMHGALGSFRARGLRLGEDLSFVGCDDVLVAELHAPQIAVVRRDMTSMGVAAAELLLELMRDGARPREIVLPTEFLVRPSCGLPRCACADPPESVQALARAAYSCVMARNLADVAKQAGVSEATVSRVLNGKPGISDATRATVLTALDVIGYERPTHLRVRRARMVGLVVPELQNPIFPALAEVVGGALAQRGFNAVLCTRTGSMSESEYVDMLLERQVSGMVFAGGQYAEADAPHDHYTRLLKLRLPVVLVNAAAEHLDFPRVSTDDAVAMEQAYGHLASLGHERIGLIIGPEDHVPSRRKLAAFQAVAERRRGGRRRAHAPSSSSARCSRSRAARPPPRG